MSDLDREEIGCHHSGRCVAPAEAAETANCIYCGKELRESGGKWWTWDAGQYDAPYPQEQEAKPPPQS
jgi:hypothetical protein